MPRWSPNNPPSDFDLGPQPRGSRSQHDHIFEESHVERSKRRTDSYGMLEQAREEKRRRRKGPLHRRRHPVSGENI